jgi:PKD domain
VTSRDGDKAGVLVVATGALAGPAAPLANATRAAMVPVQSPTAALSAVGARAGAATSFDASASTATFGSIARYDYDFGDGTSAADAGPAPAHVYAQPGSYQATVSVHNDCAANAVFGPLGTAFASVSPLCNGTPTASASTAVVIDPAPAPQDPGQGQGQPPRSPRTRARRSRPPRPAAARRRGPA